jgi:ribosomal protein L37E
MGLEETVSECSDKREQLVDLLQRLKVCGLGARFDMNPTMNYGQDAFALGGDFQRYMGSMSDFVKELAGDVLGELSPPSANTASDPFNCPKCGAHDYGLNRPACPHCGYTDPNCTPEQQAKIEATYQSLVRSSNATTEAVAWRFRFKHTDPWEYRSYPPAGLPESADVQPLYPHSATVDTDFGRMASALDRAIESERWNTVEQIRDALRAMAATDGGGNNG